MESSSPSTAQEARNLNVRIEKDGNEWIAILPPHPDLKDDEELGLPAPTEAEALDEARAYRSIEQSSVYKFEYDEKQDVYNVTFSDKTFSGKYLAPTYRDAQKAYAEFINKPEPPKPEPEPAPKARKRRAAKTPPQTGDRPLADVGTKPDPITSGIGNKPGQLPPAENRTISAWEELDQRLIRLENVMRSAIEATARVLEELRKR